jgi:hypothetical protein
MWKYRSLGPQVASTEELRLSLKELVSAGALTINNCVDITSELFGLNLSKYNEIWADVPISLLRNQSNNGTFQLKEITNSNPKNGGQQQQVQLPSEDVSVGGKPLSTGTPALPPIEYPKVTR